MHIITAKLTYVHLSRLNATCVYGEHAWAWKIQKTTESANAAVFLRFPRIHYITSIELWSTFLCNWRHICQGWFLLTLQGQWPGSDDLQTATLIGCYFTIWRCVKKYCGTVNLRIFRIFRRQTLLSSISRISISASSLFTITRLVWCFDVAVITEIW